MRPTSFAIPSAVVLVLALGSTYARADVAEEPTEENYACSVKESCPESGVLCATNPCFKDDQCPTSGVECDWRGDDYEKCMADAEAAGLTQRCDDQATVYCEASEAAPAGSVAECHATQKAAGLEARCEDENFDVVYCDPGEATPEGGADDEGGESSGCAVEQRRRTSGLGVALAVFGAAAAATALRARRRRS